MVQSADINELPELLWWICVISLPCITSFPKSHMKMMVAVCVQHACVNPGNAHYSINQRHRELLTGALFFGQSLQNKKGEKKVLFG